MYPSISATLSPSDEEKKKGMERDGDEAAEGAVFSQGRGEEDGEGSFI